MTTLENFSSLNQSLHSSKNIKWNSATMSKSKMATPENFTSLDQSLHSSKNIKWNSGTKSKSKMSTPENFTAQLQKYKVKFKHQVQDDYMKNFCISQPITGQFENHHLKWNSGTKVQFQNDYSKKFHISQLITAHLPKSSTNRVKQVNFFGAGIFWNWLLKCLHHDFNFSRNTGPISRKDYIVWQFLPAICSIM